MRTKTDGKHEYRLDQLCRNETDAPDSAYVASTESVLISDR